MIEHEDYIITQLKGGNDQAYRYLFDHYYVRLCRIAQLYVKDSFVSENIVGDLFFYLWERRETIDIHTSLGSYLFTSVRNRSLNYLQQVSVVLETRLAFSTDDLSDFGTLSSESTPLEDLIEKELESQINTAVTHLPEECKRVFQLSRYDQLSHEEIAQRLGISVNTVRYHIKNALSILRKNLQEYMNMFL
jgi:RNA polymerase sigma-70 factor (ECF subfamily)